MDGCCYYAIEPGYWELVRMADLKPGDTFVFLEEKPDGLLLEVVYDENAPEQQRDEVLVGLLMRGPRYRCQESGHVNDAGRGACVAVGPLEPESWEQPEPEPWAQDSEAWKA